MRNWLLLVIMMGILISMRNASATTSTFYSRAADGNLQTDDLIYSDAHDGPDTVTVTNTSTTMNVGQKLSGSTYYVQRGAIFFDTSSIPDADIITSATISVKTGTYYYLTYDGLQVVSGADLNEPLNTQDMWDLTDDTTSFGSSYLGASETWYTITLDTNGIAAISKTGTTAFGLRSGYDISNTAPTTDYHATIYTNESGASNLYLTVIHAAQTPPTIDSIVENSGDPVTYSTGGYTFTATISDVNGVSDISTVYFSWNGGANQSIRGSCSNVDTDTISCPYVQTSNAGSNIPYTFYAIDSGGNQVGSSGTYTINKDTPSLDITGIGTQNYPYTSTVTGTGCNGEITCKLYRDNTEITSPDSNKVYAVGSYVFIYNTTGGTNYNSATSGGHTLTINKGTPSLTLTLDGSASTPQTRTYPNATNVQSSEANSVDTDCEYVLVRNGTVISNGAVTLPAGSYNFTYNTSGCTNFTSASATRILTVNKANANVVLSPANGTITYETSSNEYCNEDTALACKIYRNGTEMTNGTIEYLPVGYWEFIANISDSVNYTNWQMLQNVTVNKLNANIILSPSNGTITYGTSSNEYCTDVSTLLNCNIYRNKTLITNDTTEYLPTGYWEFEANISDNVNYTNWKILQNVTVNEKSTTASFLETYDPIYNASTQTIQGTYTYDSTDLTNNCSLTVLSNTYYDSNPYSFTFTVTSTGSISWSVTCWHGNYTNATSTGSFTSLTGTGETFSVVSGGGATPTETTTTTILETVTTTISKGEIFDVTKLSNVGIIGLVGVGGAYIFTQETKRRKKIKERRRTIEI